MWIWEERVWDVVDRTAKAGCAHMVFSVLVVVVLSVLLGWCKKAKPPNCDRRAAEAGWALPTDEIRCWGRLSGLSTRKT